jgi:hypothetical protein
VHLRKEEQVPMDTMGRILPRLREPGEVFHRKQFANDDVWMSRLSRGERAREEEAHP